MIKKLIWTFFFFAIISCKKEESPFVILKGTVGSSEVNEITVLGNNFSKKIAVVNGYFSDTLTIVNNGVYELSNGRNKTSIFLKVGYDLNIDVKAGGFSKGILFSGKGAGTNNYLGKKSAFLLSEKANPKTYFQLDKKTFELKLEETKTTLAKYRNEASEIDAVIYDLDIQNDQRFFDYIESNYDKMHANTVKFAKGVKSPEFVNYENFNGNKTSLSDFKGKYVYIDVWATWCGPCIAEIPSLKILENDFHGENIVFVSISVDKDNAYNTWRKMVKDEELKGIQLYADKNFESDFIKLFEINTIPRFILIDPNGNIVDANALRPSNPKTKALFKELLSI